MKIGNPAGLALIGSLALGPMVGAAHTQPNPAPVATLVSGPQHAVSAPGAAPRPVQLQLAPKAAIQGGVRPFDAKTGTCNCDFGAQGNTQFSKLEPACSRSQH
jgi:hypothetical protein